jgi:hypothetical protein
MQFKMNNQTNDRRYARHWKTAEISDYTAAPGAGRLRKTVWAPLLLQQFPFEITPAHERTTVLARVGSTEGDISLQGPTRGLAGVTTSTTGRIHKCVEVFRNPSFHLRMFSFLCLAGSSGRLLLHVEGLFRTWNNY